MMMIQSAFTLGVAISLWAGQPDADSTAPTATYSLEAVEINQVPLRGGPYLHVAALPGDKITAEIYIRDWSPSDPPEHLTGTQVQFDESGFSSGPKGFVEPIDYRKTQTAKEENPKNCFIDEAHPRFIHSGRKTVAVTDTRSIGYRWLSIQIRPPGPISKQDGAKFYTGTLKLEVSDDAEGSFTLDFVKNPQASLLIQDNGAPIEPIHFEPLSIDVRIPVNVEDVRSLIDTLNGMAATSASTVPTEQNPPNLAEQIDTLNRTSNRKAQTVQPQE